MSFRTSNIFMKDQENSADHKGRCFLLASVVYIFRLVGINDSLVNAPYLGYGVKKFRPTWYSNLPVIIAPPSLTRANIETPLVQNLIRTIGYTGRTHYNSGFIRLLLYMFYYPARISNRYYVWG